jgi:hypothetical protein
MGLVINLIVVAAFVLFFVLLIYFYKRNKPIILNQIKQRFESEGILSLCEDSYFVGLASSSPAPAGGYGVWVLTSKRVYSRAYVGPFELDLEKKGKC